MDVMRPTARLFAWDDMRFFIAVCRQQTLSAAAQQLNVDHATVSRRIVRLEQALNAKLFDHYKWGYAPTLAGERLRRMVEDVETLILTCQAEISDRNLDLEGVVRVGAPDGFGSYFLAPRLAAFCNDNPKLRIDLVATARVFSLAQREIDIAISLDMPTEGRIVGRKLVDYDLGFYASEAYLDGRPPIRTKDDLEGHSFIGYIEEIIFTPLLDYLPSISNEIVPKFRSSNLIAQLQAVKGGKGIAVVPRFIAETVGGLRQVLPSEIKLQRTFYLLMHEDNKNLARVRAVANYICEQVLEGALLFAAPGSPSQADGGRSSMARL